MQLWHMPPGGPQTPGLVPGIQVPPLQQALLHGDATLQFGAHSPALHAVPEGQSASVAHPQVPPAVHMWPLGLLAQSTQAETEPQAVADAAMHIPIVPPQQKPGLQPPPSQLDVHEPATHVGVAPVHEVHLLPSEPQLAVVSPITQFVPSQHPPLQLRPPVQVVAHAPVFGSQASPLGQLADDEQPESLALSLIASWPESVLESRPVS